VPHRFAIDEARYRTGDHRWLAELDGLSVHAGPPHQRMATRAVDEVDWLRVDEHHGYEVALRRRILSEARPEVSAARPGSDVACREAAAVVDGWLSEHVPRLRPKGDSVGRTALERAATTIQEDLCVMERAHDGGWRLTAGVVCFPTYWRLADKLGRRQEAIHGPVPHYDSDLSATVSRFFDRLRPGRIVARRNWGFAAHPLLFVPDLDAVDSFEPPQPWQLWIRSERQTLRALPATGAIVFTIKVQLAPAIALTDHPAVAGRLAEAIERWSPELVAARGSRYGGIDTLVTWLGSLAAGGIGRPDPG
jgi:hypothetical protein